MNINQLFDASASWPSSSVTPASPAHRSILPAPRPEESSRFSLERLVEVAKTPAAEPRPSDSAAIGLTALRTGPLPPSSALVDPARRLVPLADRLSSPIPPPSIGVGWMYAVIGLLSGALVMLLLGFVWMTDQTATRDYTPTELSLSEAHWTPPTDDFTAFGPVIPAAADRKAKPSEPAVIATEPAAEPKSASKPRARARSSSKSKPLTVPKSKPVAKAKAKPTPAPRPAPKPDLSVDCILDPGSCGRGVTTPSTPKSPSAPKATLPDKLSSSQIKTAMAKTKNLARTCGEMHAAPKGTKVTVRLSIQGASGKVRSATPQSPHNNALGACVASKLSNASFPRFASPAMGVVYSVRM